MIPHVGIDLGTTFSCMCYINEEGLPVVINNSDGQITTPSVTYFDGKTAFVGRKANDRKLLANSPIYEFVKRDIGKDKKGRYQVNNYNYGACGFSAIILKKLRIEAFHFFKKKGWLSPNDTVNSLIIPAVITVPAYFGIEQRNETLYAGIAAGFDVIAIINEPTAAALTYGIDLNEKKKILVFDLGGGTFDVTFIEVGNNGEAIAKVTGGADQLGGKDWDELIQDYLFLEFNLQTNNSMPDDMGWEIQKAALEAKYELTDKEKITLTINALGESVDVTLYREKPDVRGVTKPNEDDKRKFYFEQRSLNKLTLCRAILTNTLAEAEITWNDLDEIVLVGGASRMPMIPKMLEKLSGKTIKGSIKGINFDTAIAEGAALYGRNRSRVVDISSKSIGIQLEENKVNIIEHLIKKNTPLPVTISETFPADANAVLKVFEGESTTPADCTPLGRLELGTSAGNVTVSLTIDFNGVIHAGVEASGVKASLRIISDGVDIDVSELKEKIDAIDIRL